MRVCWTTGGIGWSGVIDSSQTPKKPMAALTVNRPA